eukprot:TRINITY_DN6707_c0_g1_i1.p1 TRINITY_DN6707_c0_g1~~TRINITY_DN6707_c0_g1_i1.p1  ORF type:complete len:497 (-),score=48.96 TRINITY_DN6707_c0_g1_i1:128-1618(-)
MRKHEQEKEKEKEEETERQQEVWWSGQQSGTPISINCDGSPVGTDKAFPSLPPEAQALLRGEYDLSFLAQWLSQFEFSLYDFLADNPEHGRFVQQVALKQIVQKLKSTDQFPDWKNPATLEDDIDRLVPAFYRAYKDTLLGMSNWLKMDVPYEQDISEELPAPFKALGDKIQNLAKKWLIAAPQLENRTPLGGSRPPNVVEKCDWFDGTEWKTVAVKTLSTDDTFWYNKLVMSLDDSYSAGELLSFLLDHENIAKTYKLCLSPCLIIMEYVPHCLADVLDATKYEPPSIVARIYYMVDTVNALWYLVKIQIVHRDLKPSNIVLTIEGRAKLIDFGSLTYTCRIEEWLFQLAGYYKINEYTNGYAAPEIIRARQENLSFEPHELVPAMIFSVGVLLRQVLLQVKPAQTTACVDIPCLLAEDHEGLLPLCQLMNACVSLDPQKRPTMDEVVRVLTEAKEGIDEMMRYTKEKPKLAPKRLDLASSTNDRIPTGNVSHGS